MHSSTLRPLETRNSLIAGCHVDRMSAHLHWNSSRSSKGSKEGWLAPAHCPSIQRWEEGGWAGASHPSLLRLWQLEWFRWSL